MKMSMPVRKDGPSWWVDFGHEGKRYRKKSPINTQAGAREYELILRHRLLTGQAVDDPKPLKPTISFQEFSERWFETYVKANNKPSEIENKRGVLKNHLLPFFGLLDLHGIKREKVEEYKSSKLGAGLNPKTVNGHLATLAKCLRCAVEWEAVDEKDVPKIQKLKTSSRHIDFLSPTETAQLLQDRSEPLWNLMTYVALRTGLRFGELLGLRWEAINLEQDVLSVQESIVRGVVGTPKSGKVRHVPIAKDLHEELLKHRKTRGRLFTQPGYEHISHRMAANALRRIKKRVGLRHINWHMFRHTFASHLAMNGTPIPVIQKFMGHASIEMTMRYAHLSPNAHADSVNCFRTMEREAEEAERQPSVSQEIAVV